MAYSRTSDNFLRGHGPAARGGCIKDRPNHGVTALLAVLVSATTRSHQWVPKTLVYILLLLTLGLSGLFMASDATGAEAKEADSVEISSDDELFFLANTLHILFHEFGHVLIHDLDLPILGREEDAADTIATIGILTRERASPDVDNQFTQGLLAIANAWWIIWQKQQQQNSDLAFWTRHAISGQRFYNIVCFIYGSNPRKFEKLLELAKLPPERADWCVEEFELASRSVERFYKEKVLEKLAKQEQKTGSITIIYDRPETALGVALVKLLKREGLIEKTARYVESHFALPQDLRVQITQCGAPGAGWDPEARELVLCYEFLELYYHLAQEQNAEARRRVLEAPN